MLQTLMPNPLPCKSSPGNPHTAKCKRSKHFYHNAHRAQSCPSPEFYTLGTPHCLTPLGLLNFNFGRGWRASQDPNSSPHNLWLQEGEVPKP
mmetsp:Transcript_26364/g.41236  ORF Transcript_26364/g.41236 Transcript_26364/m.41236 type:complete len:92 (-) Transcript_26364:779-1054(-)